MGVFKRNGNYWIDYYDGNGIRHRKLIGPQKTLAKIALNDVKVKVAKGEYLGIYEEKKVAFKDFAKKTYLPYAKVNLSVSTYNRCEGIIQNHLVTYFNAHRIFKITRKQVENYKQKRAKEVEPATVNREFSRLRHMFKCAIDWGYIKNNPCKGVKELKEPPGRVRYLSHEEMDRLLMACDPASLLENPNNKNRDLSKLVSVYLKPIVLIAIHSGMRRGEIMGLKWKDIDFKEKRITLMETKNNDLRTIFMNDVLIRVLKALPVQLHSEKVFTGINGNMVSVAFERACKRANINDFRFHDLRHTFASYLVMGGINLRTIQTLLGHRDLRMTMKYSHLSPEYLQEAVLTLEKSLTLREDVQNYMTG
jgi:integrase